MGLRFFFDTYALFELIYGNSAYARFKHVAIVTTRLNLMELHYGLLAKYGKDIADTQYDRFLKYCVAIQDETIKQANKFRLLNRRHNPSYIDSIGYTIATSAGIPFLTGDRAFKGLPGVEFIP